MTVASLWKALDSGGSGKQVGVTQIVGRSDRPTVLAVDLSIWICEALTSKKMAEQHANPVNYLVFTRAIKLLHCGIRLVGVIEGKQRVNEKLRKRRGGTSFWKACNDCQALLENLGITVVKAKAEGEGLCALLSQQGLVDGVISNDGDCLLFGAKVVYTKFSNENLEHGNVIRYDLESLYASENGAPNDAMRLSRHDLISFAILTGSDIVGSGMEKTGHKKALRFIRKCQEDHPLTREKASLDEMKSWANAATADVQRSVCIPVGKSGGCTRCSHPGSCKSHLKFGCNMCGTGPGEQCHEFTVEDRFRQSLRVKALAALPRFDPSWILSVYLRPNQNQIPRRVSNGVEHSAPDIDALMAMKQLVKGKTHAGSKSFVSRATYRLLARTVLLTDRDDVLGPRNGDTGVPREQPSPKEITRQFTKNDQPFYELRWTANATITDDDGSGIDGYEYVTAEPCDLIKNRFPQLVDDFEIRQVQMAQQGDGMQNQRRFFLDAIVFRGPHEPVPTKKQKCREYFEQPGKCKKKKHKSSKQNHHSDDLGVLMRIPNFDLVVSPAKTKKQMTQEAFSPVDRRSRPEKAACRIDPGNVEPGNHKSPDKENDVEEELFCHMGGFEIQITPIQSNRGCYPPKHVYLHLSK